MIFCLNIPVMLLIVKMPDDSNKKLYDHSRWPTERSLLEYKFRSLINAGNSTELIKTFNDMCSGTYNFDSLLNFVLEMFATSENFSNKLFLEFNLNGLTHFPNSKVRRC
jgi:hypothetical protein